MILWGEIREFPLFTMLQFLAQQRRTGVLEIQDFEDLGRLYFSQGRIDAISNTAWDEMLGTRLVSIRALTETEVRECWMQHSNDEEKPVLACLLDMAQGERRDLIDVVNRHVADAVMQLMYWNAGTFRFTVPAKQVRFAVLPTLDVENLLLDAYRRVDEGERPWRDKISLEQELCLTCTIECTPEIKSRYLKADICLWRSMPSVLKDPIFRGVKKVAGGRDEDAGMDELQFV